MADLDWNDKQIAKLKQLWADGLPIAEIGRQLGCSKNAAGGKARRLNLPPRPSPIRLGGQVQPPRPRRMIKAMIPRAPIEAEQPTAALASRRIYRTESCCWPMGEPRMPGFHYCDAPTRGGRLPYCDAHYAIAAPKQMQVERTA
jgi:GcrA cell cycle regulator